MAIIEIRHVSKIFGADPESALAMLEQGAGKDAIFERTGQAVGLADVSFDVNEGEILVVMGLSGSGKSTLIRCINRLIEPTSGTITVAGQDITALDAAGLRAFRRNKLGMVFQNFALLPHRSIMDNVEYGLEIQGIEPEKRREMARKALSMVGLEGWENARPVQLSGGMQQRVGLARALAVDPPILLMDEAFSALDPLIRRDMQNELVALHARMGQTILFISHDLDEAIKIGDRIVLMKDGAVIQVGTPEEILTRPADDYVERFVEDVNVAKVLTAGSVMIKPHTLAYTTDGPRTVLHKLHEEGYGSLIAVERDGRWRGIVTVDDVEQALQAGKTDLTDVIQTDIPSVAPQTPITDLFGMLPGMHSALPVVEADGRLRGIVIKAAVLEALSRETTQHSKEVTDAGHPEVSAG